MKYIKRHPRTKKKFNEFFFLPYLRNPVPEQNEYSNIFTNIKKIVIEKLVKFDLQLELFDVFLRNCFFTFQHKNTVAAKSAL